MLYEAIREKLRSSLALAAKNDQDHIKLDFENVKYLCNSVERIYYEGILHGAMDSKKIQKALDYFLENP